MVCKLRGFTLNVRGAAVLNFQTMKDNILAELENPLDDRRTTNVVTPYYFQRDLEQKPIKVVPRIKQYGLVLDKRVINTDTRSSYPYRMRTRPVCNQGLLESSLNKKKMILTSIQCVFL